MLKIEKIEIIKDYDFNLNKADRPANKGEINMIIWGYRGYQKNLGQTQKQYRVCQLPQRHCRTLAKPTGYTLLDSYLSLR